MQWRYIRHVPVVDDSQRLVGLITHRDLLRASLSSLEEVSRHKREKRNLEIPVKRIMQKDLLTVEPHTSIREAAKLLLENKFGCLPVIRKGKLSGILTEADFVRSASSIV